MIVGRTREQAAIESAFDAGTVGLAAVVLEGEAGIGKSVLWASGVESARIHGSQVLSCRSTPAETRLAWTGLADLLHDVGADCFDRLPDPQRRAIDIALLREDAQSHEPDARTIGTGLVSIVRGLAATGPVVIAVDDLQWLDPPTARVLEFAFGGSSTRRRRS